MVSEYCSVLSLQEAHKGSAFTIPTCEASVMCDVASLESPVTQSHANLDVSVKDFVDVVSTYNYLTLSKRMYHL